MDSVKIFDLNIVYGGEEEECTVNDELLNEDDNLVFDDFIEEFESMPINDDVEVVEEMRDNEPSNENNIADEDAEMITEPATGLVFESVQILLDFCHHYGKAKGFQVRVRSSEKKKGVVKEVQPIECNRYIKDYTDCKRLRFVCSKAGLCDYKSKHPGRPVSSIRTGCQFKVNAAVCEDGIFWKINKVSLEHNHECKSENANFMPSYRHISLGNKMILLDNDRAGVPIAKNYTIFVVRYGGHQKVPFDERDCRNAISLDRRLKLEQGDFVAMRRYFDKMISSGSNFFYDYDTEEDGTLRNVFWADGHSRGAYEDFGDIVSFDTTYVKNRYRMPFAPIIGVNNHGQSILFGCALLAGEETENFVRLFKTWLVCMNNKAPKGILTDQCKAMENAIAEVFPEAKHRWCIWHVMRNANKHLDKTKGLWIIVCRGLQKVLYNSLTIYEFEEAWKDWIAEFGLEANTPSVF